MEQVPVLGLIVTLALGLVSLTMLARRPAGSTGPGLRSLPVTLLLYNLWVMGFLASRFFEGSGRIDAADSHGSTMAAAGLALVVLSLAWLYAHILQIDALLQSRGPARLVRAARWGVGAAVTALILAFAWSKWSGSETAVRLAGGLVSAAVFPCAAWASGLLWVRARRLPDVKWGERLRVLGASYLALFSCLSALAFAWHPLTSISAELPLVIDLVLEVLYNGIAIAWVWGIEGSASATGAAEGKPMPASVAVPDAGHGARLLEERGVTKREREIAALICQGKTNQEIADLLFISVATVKDHNYVLFQKLGVRNRTELARLLLGAIPIQPK